MDVGLIQFHSHMIGQFIVKVLGTASSKYCSTTKSNTYEIYQPKNSKLAIFCAMTIGYGYDVLKPFHIRLFDCIRGSQDDRHGNSRHGQESIFIARNQTLNKRGKILLFKA